MWATTPIRLPPKPESFWPQQPWQLTFWQPNRSADSSEGSRWLDRFLLHIQALSPQPSPAQSIPLPFLKLQPQTPQSHLSLRAKHGRKRIVRMMKKRRRRQTDSREHCGEVGDGESQAEHEEKCKWHLPTFSSWDEIQHLKRTSCSHLPTTQSVTEILIQI